MKKNSENKFEITANINHNMIQRNDLTHFYDLVGFFIKSSNINC